MTDNYDFIVHFCIVKLLLIKGYYFAHFHFFTAQQGSLHYRRFLFVYALNASKILSCMMNRSQSHTILLPGFVSNGHALTTLYGHQPRDPMD